MYLTPPQSSTPKPHSSSRKIDPFNPEVSMVIKFLTMHFKDGNSYSTLNTDRLDSSFGTTVVLDYLENLGSSSELSLKVLTFKTIMLLACFNHGTEGSDPSKN